MEEINQKISRLQTPKRFSVLPVLIHVNGATESVIESDFFAHIVDFADFLLKPTNS